MLFFFFLKSQVRIFVVQLCVFSLLLFSGSFLVYGSTRMSRDDIIIHGFLSLLS